MGLVHAREAARYVEVWNSLDRYGDMAPGELWADSFVEMTGAAPGGSVLDAGAGSGKGGLELHKRGYRVTLCDLTDAGLVDEARRLPFVEACLWHKLPRAVGGFVDWVYCCDVLEHVPEEFTMLTITRLLSVARRGVFLSIAFEPDQFGRMLGTQLHHTVREFTWWRDRLGELGELVEARDCLVAGLFLVRPRA